MSRQLNDISKWSIGERKQEIKKEALGDKVAVRAFEREIESMCQLKYVHLRSNTETYA